MGIILIDIKLLPRTTDFDFWMSVVVSQIDRQGREKRLLSQDFETGSIASIVQVHQNFQSLYQDWSTYAQGGEIPLRIGRGLTITPNQIGNYSQSDEQAKKDRCNQELSNTIEQLSDWLDRSISTKFIDSIRDKVKDLTTCQIRLAIEVSKPQLQDLPWDKCTNSKLINRLSDFDRSINTIVSMSNVQGSKIWSNIRKILIIQGYNEDIDTDADVTFIKRHLPRYIVSVTEDKPSLIRFNQLLWDEQWDAIFYLGHTETNFAGDDGIIRINHTETVSIDDLSNAFSKAVDRGLQMLVFNSCSGMGLARRLDRILRDRQKRSPYVIVMRRLIGDSIAHIFIDRFAQHLFKDKLSIEQAITQARNFIKTENARFPGADSLPVLWCSGRALPLKIRPDLRQKILHSWLFAPQSATKLFGHKMKIPPIAIIGIVLAAIIVGSKLTTPTPEPMESMGEHLLFAQKTSPNKQLGIKAFLAKDYVRAIEELGIATRQQPNDPEAQIYLNNARVLEQTSTPDKLPVIPVISSKSDGFQTAQEVLRGVAIAQRDINQQGGIHNQKILLKIVIDNNDEKQAIQVAKELVKDARIKGIVGHTNSNSTLAASPIYQSNGLVMVT